MANRLAPLTYADWEGDPVLLFSDPDGYVSSAYVHQDHLGWHSMHPADAFTKTKLLRRDQFERMFPQAVAEMSDIPELKKKALATDEFDPAKHPRGQPENAGEFGPGGGGGPAKTTPSHGVSSLPEGKLSQTERLVGDVEPWAKDVEVTVNPTPAMLARMFATQDTSSTKLINYDRPVVRMLSYPGSGDIAVADGHKFDHLVMGSLLEDQAHPMAAGVKPFEHSEDTDPLRWALTDEDPRLPNPRGHITYPLNGRRIQVMFYDDKVDGYANGKPVYGLKPEKWPEGLRRALGVKLAEDADWTAGILAADAEFDPSEHPHAPKGAPEGTGGEFVKKGTGTTGGKFQHFTANTNLESIRKHGLRPGASGYVHLEQAHDPAGPYTDPDLGGHHTTIHVDPEHPSMKDVKIASREHAYLHGGQEYLTKQTIPPEALSFGDEPVEGAISTRLPSEPAQRKAGVDVHTKSDSLIDWQTALRPEAKDYLKRATDLLVGRELYPAGRNPKTKLPNPKEPYVGMPPGPVDEKPEDAAERFMKFAVGNILAIYHAVPDVWRDRASKWYDGAHTLAQNWAKEYHYSLPQMAGVLAALSPKKDWYQNVDIAKRLLDYTRDKQDIVFDEKARLVLSRLASTRASIEDRRAYRAIMKRITGKKLGEVIVPMDRAAWIVAYDRAHGDLRYQDLTPEGKFIPGWHTNKGDEDEENEIAKPGKLGAPTTVTWPTLDNVEKALKILDDGSIKNISENTGKAHKVRNFYMNILDPMSRAGHVTIDTHAIAAAFLRPLGLKAPQVIAGLGRTVRNDTLGLGGTYPMIAEAYRRAAKQISSEGHEVLPRQMQSIVWEGLRGLFSPEAKRNKNLKKDVDDIWRKHMAGTIDEAQARKEIMELASPGGGIPRTPGWNAVPP